MDTFNPNQMPPLPGQEEKKSVGPLIAVIIILALIIIGGLYFLKERSSIVPYTPALTNTSTTTSDSVTASLNQQSSSDNLNSIESDLNATNVDNLDQGASAVEAQLQ